MKKVRVLIEKGSDGTFGAYMPDDDNLEWGIHGDGATVAEAIADFNACYADMKALFAEEGRHFTEAEFSFAYDVPSFLLYYGDMITYKGLAKLTGLSASQLSQYISGYRKPSPKTTRKIEKALHDFGKELSCINFV